MAGLGSHLPCLSAKLKPTREDAPKLVRLEYDWLNLACCTLHMFVYPTIGCLDLLHAHATLGCETPKDIVAIGSCAWNLQPVEPIFAHLYVMRIGVPFVQISVRTSNYSSLGFHFQTCLICMPNFTKTLTAFHPIGYPCLVSACNEVHLANMSASSLLPNTRLSALSVVAACKFTSQRATAEETNQFHPDLTITIGEAHRSKQFNITLPTHFKINPISPKKNNQRQHQRI